MNRILIVDDIPDNIQVAANILKNGDFKVFVATNPRSVFEIIKNHHIDLILLDIMMPEMNGFEVCKQLKEDAESKDIPVIFLTASNDIESINTAFKLGGVDYITKPFNTSELIARVRTHLLIIEQKEELSLAKQEVEELNRFSLLVQEEDNLKEIFIRISEYIFERFHIEVSALLLPDSTIQSLSIFRFYSYPKISDEEYNNLISCKIPLSGKKGIFYQTFKQQKPLYLPDITTLESELSGDIVQNLKLKSLLLVPLVIAKQTIGIYFFSNLSKDFILSQRDINSINNLCQQISGVIRNVHLLEEVKFQREQSDRLLLNILPQEVAFELKNTGKVEPLFYESVSILFTDFKGFTKIAEEMSPKELIESLDSCFSHFDGIAEKYGIEKLKTIGDAYMCAGGLPVPNHTHAVDICLMALDIHRVMLMAHELKKEIGLPYWVVRMGIHSGPVMAGTIGKKKFSYDIWGDTVNTASRMESSGTPEYINVSEETYRLVRDFFDFEYRGKISAKNKGEIDMYYLLGIRSKLTIPDTEKPNEEFWKLYRALNKNVSSKALPEN